MKPEASGRRWILLAWVGVTAGACIAAFVLVYLGTVQTTAGRRVGDQALRGAILTHSRLTEQVDQVLDVVSVASLLGAVALIAMIALARLRRSSGLAAVGLLVGANLTTKVLKDLVLTRPDLGLSEVSPATLNSMPSGHVTAAFSVVAGLLFVVPARLRMPVAVGGVGYASATALSTMSSGWHRAGDGMAAFLVVGVWVALAAAVLAIEAPEGGEPNPVGGGWVKERWWLVIGSGFLTLGLLLMATLAFAALVRNGTIGALMAFAAAALLLVGTATVVTWAELALLRLVTSRPSVSKSESALEEQGSPG